jgi:hypothetical protein
MSLQVRLAPLTLGLTALTLSASVFASETIEGSAQPGATNWRGVDPVQCALYANGKSIALSPGFLPPFLGQSQKLTVADAERGHLAELSVRGNSYGSLNLELTVYSTNDPRVKAEFTKNHLPWVVKLGRDDKAQSSRRGLSGGLQDVAVPPVHVGDVDYAARCVDYEPELSPKLEDGPIEHAQLGLSERSGHEDLMSERSGHQDL